MMKHKYLIGAGIAAVALAAVVGGVIQAHRRSRDAFEVASVLPLTGAAAEMGQDMKRGQELAVEYFNASPGIRRRIQVSFEDSRSTPTDGTRAVQSLLARGFRFFVVPLSTVGMAVRPALIEAKALAFLDASHPGLTQPPHPWIFRHSQTAEAEARVIAPAAIEQAGVRRLFLFYMNDDYGRTFLETFRSVLGRDTSVEAFTYETTTTDLRSVVQASGLASTEGAAAIAVGVGRPLGLLIKAIREDGFRGTVFTSMGYIATGARGILGEDRADILYTDLSWRNTTATAWLVAEYRHRYSKEAPAAAVIEFQTILVLAGAAADADEVNPVGVAARISQSAERVVGAAPTSANDLIPVVILRAEPDGRPR